MKRTKIVATISDLRCDIDFIRDLYKAGMNVARLNTAHQSIASTRQIIENIRAVSDKIAIIIDTKGPELRTCKVDEEFELKSGDKIFIKGDTEGISTKKEIFVRYNKLVRDVPVGNIILIDDGQLSLRVINKTGDALLCEALNNGIIQSRKSVNVPNVSINLPALNEKDKKYVQFAIDQDIDFLAHSFVRNKEDLFEIQKMLDEHKSRIKIISKIENQQGLENIDEIIEHSYGIMVARGDLAIEMPYEKIPIVQKELINKCIVKRKPVIIATQMLHSMINSPRPTRAEVSDVANAIYAQADAIMLSNETASGYYPVEAVKTMASIAEEIEKDNKPFKNILSVVLSSEISAYLTKSAVKASIRLGAKAIIADTLTGRTIRNLAGYRGKKPVIARCYNKKIMRELALSYGVQPQFMEARENSLEFVNETLGTLLKQKYLSKEDLVVVVAGNFGTHHGASFIEISTVKNMLRAHKISLDAPLSVSQ
jgi:pyruvate kinase